MKTVILLMLIVACSFKPDPKSQKLSSAVESVNIDSDGDGVSDNDEISQGTNPFIADVPEFNGDFFEELKLSVQFYRPENNSTLSSSFQVSRERGTENGVPYEERDFLTKGSNFYNEIVSREMRSSGLIRNVFVYNIPTPHEYMSPPRLNDSRLFPFTKNLNRNLRTHRADEVELLVSGRLEIKSPSLKSYSNVMVDLFFYDEVKRNQTLIDSYPLPGTYLFNKDYKVGFTFKTRSEDSVSKLLLSGGRNVFLKIRDYKIDDNGKFYSSLIEEVSRKSINLILNDSERTKSLWIGVNGFSENLPAILSRAGLVHQISGSEVRSLLGKTTSKTIERNSYGEGVEVFSKWIIGTEPIQGDAVSFKYNAGDRVYLNYVSSSEKFNLIPTFKSVLADATSTKTLFVDNVLSTSVEDYRITIFPVSFTGYEQKVSRNSNCSKGLCFEYKVESNTHLGLKALPLVQSLEMNINGISSSIFDMINDGRLLIRQKYVNAFELKFNSHKIQKNSNLTIKISHMPRANYCEGPRFCELYDITCIETYRSSFPHCNEPKSIGLLDQTKKINHAILSESILTVEYL